MFQKLWPSVPKRPSGGPPLRAASALGTADTCRATARGAVLESPGGLSWHCRARHPQAPPTVTLRLLPLDASTQDLAPASPDSALGGQKCFQPRTWLQSSGTLAQQLPTLSLLSPEGPGDRGSGFAFIPCGSPGFNESNPKAFSVPLEKAQQGTGDQIKTNKTNPQHLESGFHQVRSVQPSESSPLPAWACHTQ